jgi:hypothetical protein
MLRTVANSETIGKLQLEWEGPYLVVSSRRPGLYMLKDMDGNDIPRSWNADELHMYNNYVIFRYMVPFFLSSGEKGF